MRPRIEIPIGSRFGKLTVVGNEGGALWRCVCDCGKETYVKGTLLKSGNKQSCGCLHSEMLAKRNRNNAKHGARQNGKKERLYEIWCQMKTRCERKTHKSYSYYGGRGIRVCDEWRDDYTVFKEWALLNGYKDDLSIDRIDVNGNYEPSNCRWATAKEQANNRRNNRLIEFNGKTQTINEWALETGLSYRAIHGRIFQSGWPVEKALTTPNSMTNR